MCVFLGNSYAIITKRFYGAIAAGGCAAAAIDNLEDTRYRHFGTIATKLKFHMSKLPEKLWPHVHPDVRVDTTTLVLKNISKKWITAAKSKPPDKLC